jgi:hypothetical protein
MAVGEGIRIGALPHPQAKGFALCTQFFKQEIFAKD